MAARLELVWGRDEVARRRVAMVQLAAVERLLLEVRRLRSAQEKLAAVEAATEAVVRMRGDLERRA